MTDVRRPLLLIAASGLAREVAAAARAAGRDVLGCLDDDPARWGSDAAPGLRVLGGVDEVKQHPDAELLICAGKGTVRERLFERLCALGLSSDRFGTVLHPAASVVAGAAVGAGSVLLAGVVVTADVTIGDHVVCMPNVVLTHDDRIEPFATLCAGVLLGGSVTVGRAAYVGMGATVRERLAIGPGAVVGMGSVVVRDIGAGETWAGVPARPLRRLPDDEGSSTTL